MTLTFLKSTGQLVCRMCLCLDLCNVVLSLELSHFLLRTPQKCCGVLSTSCHRFTMAVYLSLAVLTSSTWLSQHPSSFFIVKLSFFVVVGKCLGWDILTLCKFCFFSNSYPLTCRSSLQYILLWCLPTMILIFVYIYYLEFYCEESHIYLSIYYLSIYLSIYLWFHYVSRINGYLWNSG